MDMQLAEQLKNKIEEVTEDIKIEIDLLPPSLPSITLPSSSYSFLIHQSISFTIDMNGVMNCHITPSLPQGLILNRTTCTISGTLTSLSFSSYNITAISHSNTFIRIVSIEIISSLISYPQTNLIIGQGLSFSITPNLTKVSTISIVSGSLPIGLSINPSTGVISGSPSQLLSSQSVTIEAMSGTAIETVVLSFTVITPISSFSYSQSSYVLSRDDPVSIIPTVNGDELSFSIISGSLPIDLSLNPSTGMISGTPSQSVSSQSVTIKAFNQVSDQSFSLSFTIQLIPSSLNYNQTIFIIQNNTYFIIKPTCEGDDLSFSIISGSLPIGLSFHSSTGIISGTPLSCIPLTSPFKHPIKSDQLNSQSPFKSLFLYPIFIILNSHSLSSKDNHSQSLQSFQETILYSQSLQELFLLVYLSINQLESFLVFLHLHSHLHLSLFRLPINSDSFKLNYPLLSTLYPLSLSFSSLFLFLSFSLF